MNALKRLFFRLRYCEGLEEIAEYLGLDDDEYAVLDWRKYVVGFPVSLMDGKLVAKKSKLITWKLKNEELIQERKEAVLRAGGSMPLPDPRLTKRTGRW